MFIDENQGHGGKANFSANKPVLACFLEHQVSLTSAHELNDVAGRNTIGNWYLMASFEIGTRY